MYRIHNWEKYQHYKTRRPPWVKLYRDLLENADWYYLSGDDAKLLIELWLVAAETDGVLPASNVLAFRLRRDSTALAEGLRRLCRAGFVDDVADENMGDTNDLQQRYHDASTTLAQRKQNATPEKEKERETETEGEKETDARAGYYATCDADLRAWIKSTWPTFVEVCKLSGGLPGRFVGWESSALCAALTADERAAIDRDLERRRELYENADGFIPCMPGARRYIEEQCWTEPLPDPEPDNVADCVDAVAALDEPQNGAVTPRSAALRG